MESTAPLRNVSRLAYFAVFWAGCLTGIATAQESKSPAMPSAQVAAAVKQLDELVRQAERLVEHGDMAAARAACGRALEHARLDETSAEWSAAADSALWRLGHAAYRSGDIRTAHSAWGAVRAHRAATLPDEHPDLQQARHDLARTKKALGDLPEALALQEKVFAVRSRTLPDEHPDLQRARNNLALTKKALGDLPGALALQEKVFAVRSRTLPDEHPDLQRARHNLALTKKALGDLPGALALQEKVFAVRSRTLPDEHPDLQWARNNLANTKAVLGDLPGALALQEKVFAVRSRTLPDEHRDLQAARNNLAATKHHLGDLAGARALLEKVFAVHSRTLPDEHPDLLRARNNLAVTKKALGDLPGALALQEKVFAVHSRTLPDEHPDLQRTRNNLASTKYALGDLPGAHALLEKVFAVLAKSLPDEHPDLQPARGNLAITKKALGDLPGALALQEKVFAVRSRTLPDEHPDLQQARLSLAITKKALGDLPGALALQEKVFAIRSRTLPDEHPDLQQARLSLAITKKALGDLPGALALEERVFAVRSKTLPNEHPDLQRTRNNLANTKWALGDLHGAAELNRSAVAGALAQLSSCFASTRDASQLAIASNLQLSYVGSLLDSSLLAAGKTPLPTEMSTALARDALSLLVAAHSIEAHTARLLRDVRSTDPTRFDEMAQAIAAASRAVEDAIAFPLEGRTDADGNPVSRQDAIRQAVLAKDAAERALTRHVPEHLRGVPTARTLGAALAADEAAVAFLTYTCWTIDPDEPWKYTSQQRYGALVLTASSEVAWHSLAPVRDVRDRVAQLRNSALGETRGKRPARATARSDLLGQLRQRLLDPIRAALPASTTRLVVSLADDMHLLPIEALGGKLELRIVPSLRALVAPTKAVPKQPRALVLGSVDYDAKPSAPAPVIAEVATPVLGDADSNRSGNDGDDSSGDRKPKLFNDLFNTEAQWIAKAFAKSCPDGEALSLTGIDASEAAFSAQAKGKAYLHLATHGYFAPESAWRATETDASSPLSRFDIDQRDRVAQLSPFSLTGIALTGANLPADELGRREGILTAQEITQLDLTECYLATLSACETSLGVKHGGQGLASLRQAFHAAGARYVLATLWEINDVQAEKLMADFYTRLWKRDEEPHAALRAAKRAARERGAGFRDWAGWVLTGR